MRALRVSQRSDYKTTKLYPAFRQVGGGQRVFLPPVKLPSAENILSPKLCILGWHILLRFTIYVVAAMVRLYSICLSSQRRLSMSTTTNNLLLIV